MIRWSSLIEGQSYFRNRESPQMRHQTQAGGLIQDTFNGVISRHEISNLRLLRSCLG